MATNFLVTRFRISDTARLSLSLWQDGALWRGSAVIFRLRGGKWSLDSDTAVDVVSHIRSGRDAARREDCDYRLTQAGAQLAAAELGEALPLRFFRDNAL